MKKQIRNIFIAVTSMMLLSQAVIAGSAGNSETSGTKIDSSSSDNIKAGADKTAAANGSSSGLSQIIGAVNVGLSGMYAAKFAASCSHGCNGMYAAQAVLHALMAAQSFKQSKQNSNAQYNAGLTGLDTSTYSPGYTPTDSNAGGNSGLFDLKGIDGNKGKVNLSNIKDTVGKFTSGGIGGIKIDPKTGVVTDTNTGKKYDPDKLNSVKALTDAGFSPQAVADAYGASGKAEEKLKKELGVENIGAATKENGYESGSSGSGGSLSGGGSSASGDSGYGGRGVASLKAPSGQIAGLSKNFNGDRIGVAAENIFNMMARRYKTKEKQNSFFDPSEMVKMPQ